MMKKIFYLFIIVTICSCSSEDSDPDFNKNYLKSFITDSGFPETSYEYNHGFLTKSNFLNVTTTYEYDTTGNLIIKKVGNQKYSYLYDNQNRLIKEIKDGTNDYISLTYSTNKIIVNDYSSTNGTNLVSEVYLDNLNRVIKTIQLTSTYFHEYLIQEFIYDNNNNIVSRSYSGNVDNGPDLIINFQFDNKINPFYTSNKKLFNSIYYLECRKEFPIDRVNPNNIISVLTSTLTSSRELTYNAENYPIKSTVTTYENGSITQTEVSFYEYY